MADLSKTLNAILREPRAATSCCFLLLLVTLAIFAPALAPRDPLEQDLMLSALPPAWIDGAEPGFLLGTDDLGRDIFSRVIFGARIALIVAVAASFFAAAIGSALGLIAGWYGGWADRIISRLIDVWMAFPPVLLSVLLVAVLGSGLTSVIVAIAIIDWTRFARVVRAETQAQAGLDYVTSARAIGFPQGQILMREILPNVAPVIIALISLQMGISVIVEAILSFVGLSVSSDIATWGGMIASGRQLINESWWVLVFPLIALFLTVLAFNLLGAGLRRALDPVMRR
ncbi:ABC transporter permease [Rhizobium sp. FY34]|uniref:ABC transporter permease n=1 Tax=Rhizobium sp. FY34 TaxID=2562309 RepID=UPI0010BFEC65|nr:ABC transporter permease [Rhizobium sp. FY34]